MVDFRYHLVSLVSVFLALAIGIVLGAGPLQNSIGNALTGQVQSLRNSRDTYRADLDAANAELEHQNAALAAAGSQLLKGTLSGRKVGLIVLNDVNDEDVSALSDQLTKAGAGIVSQIQATDVLSDANQASYRSALAGSLADNVEGVPADANADQKVAAALSTMMRQGPDSQTAQTIQGLLTPSDKPLISVTKFSGAAEAIVMIGPRDQVEPSSAASASSKESPRTDSDGITKVDAAYFNEIARQGAAVAVGAGTDGKSFVATVRSSNSGSSVDGMGSVQSYVNTAIAVAHELKGQHVRLGNTSGADAALGAVVSAAA
ncbi:MAG: copper transporter [Actinomycetaceae bacterium]|nr:copper transporter [Actinomycetaceae bacterium]MDY6083245.1 copper transporter [Actinomycetaceae bacterium]